MGDADGSLFEGSPKALLAGAEGFFDAHALVDLLPQLEIAALDALGPDSMTGSQSAQHGQRDQGLKPGRFVERRLEQDRDLSRLGAAHSIRIAGLDLELVFVRVQIGVDGSAPGPRIFPIRIIAQEPVLKGQVLRS